VSIGDNILVWIVCSCQMLGPIVFLVWVWRRTGSWLWIALSGLFVVPIASFTLGGGILALSTAFRVFILDIGMTGPTIGMTNWQYVSFTFEVCGIYGVGFSGMGLLLTVPLVGLWYLVHQTSFKRLIRRPSRPPPVV
jgi:hypothetical protein